MKTEKRGNVIKLWLSAEDTYAWAHRPGDIWPCSSLAGKTLFAEFEDGDLVDYAVDGIHGEDWVPVDEFNAITSDFIKEIAT